MQRVLSFQMARGFGESSEFVTKRMCFSFLFCVGFLSLLCGFLIGRFSAGRVTEIRAEKARIQLAGNGLENKQYLRDELIQHLRDDEFKDDYRMGQNGSSEDAFRIKEAFLDLQFFQRVEVQNSDCVIGTARGINEPDRYVVVSGHGEGEKVVMALSKAFKKLAGDNQWRPKRNMKLMISLKSPDACRTTLSKHLRSQIVGYVEINVPSITDDGYFATTGSDIVHSSILEAAAVGIKNPKYKNDVGESPMVVDACGGTSCPMATPRLRFDVPNAELTFIDLKNDTDTALYLNHVHDYRLALAQAIAITAWKLSEMTIFQWEPYEFNKALVDHLQTLNSTQHAKLSEMIITEVEKMTKMFIDFNTKTNGMERTKALDVRIANDIWNDLRRALLCWDDDMRSRTDWFELRKLGDDLTSTNAALLKLLNCYETANDILTEDYS